METATRAISKDEIAKMIRTEKLLYGKGNCFELNIPIKHCLIRAFMNDDNTTRTLKEITDSHRIHFYYWHGFSHQGSLDIKLIDGDPVAGRAWQRLNNQDNLVNAAEKVVDLLGGMVDLDEMRKELLRRVQ
jgi:hypothetical protein